MQLRSDNIAKLKGQSFDVLILGGGINGAVSAASLAAKGVSTALIDRGDFAGETSSNSSNLAWGGIKYLESHEYFLVNKLCKSRNHLMSSYPSTVKEIRFLTTIQKGFRFHPLFVYMGTILYWIMGRFFTQSPRYLNSKKIKQTESVINTSNASGGFEYSDSYLFDNDARFVFNFIQSSMQHGCTAANYVESIGSERKDGWWVTQMRDVLTRETFEVKSKALINSCGPMVDAHNKLTEQKTEHRHLFSKGIHLIVDQITPNERILAFFASDGRLFFVIPMGPKTCVGTTDTQVESPKTYVTEEDRQFVLDNINSLLKLDKPLTAEDVISERCGVRPLALKGRDGVADWVKLSRKHAIDVNSEDKHLSIFGGKLTDCINVGDEVAELIADLGIEVPENDKIWYGEPAGETKDDFMRQAKLIGLDSLTKDGAEPLTQRLWRRYGAKAFSLLDLIKDDASQADVLLEHTEFIRCEFELIARSEMVTKLEDFLRRRSKVSLVVRRDDIMNAAGLKEVCEILFGDQAEAKLQEYIEMSEPKQSAA